MEPTLEALPDLVTKTADVEALGTASASARKSGGSKDSGNSILNSVNKHTSHIRKPPHRRSASPLNWFPRKKTDSFLKRKIRYLQEAGGMSSTLDEILDDANPHYSRMMREKIAAREAAQKAMEARKAAMVEASWCRILRAARIQSNEAEAELEEAEKQAAEAFQAASAMGVMMYDKPDGPRRACEIQTSSGTGEKSTHTITASFETEFEVDKEVAAAVKKAFIRLASCPSSSNKEEFRVLLHKISQNPDNIETDQELCLDIPTECETDPGSEHEAELQGASVLIDGDDVGISDAQAGQKEHKNKQISSDHDKVCASSSKELVSEMLERLKGLQDDQLAALAIIVATCGLNDALLEVDGGSKDHGSDPITDCTLRPSLGGTNCGKSTRKDAVAELPSLDKFLVKHVSRLEREVQEARNLKKENSTIGHQRSSGPSEVEVGKEQAVNSVSSITSLDSASDLGSILVKHVSRLERDIQKAKTASQKNDQVLAENIEQPDLGLSEAKADKENIHVNRLVPQSSAKETPQAKFDRFKHISRIERAKLETLRTFSSHDGYRSNQMHEQASLAEILVKPVHRLEREKAQALEHSDQYTIKKENRKQVQGIAASDGLDKILVKPVHRLEREKAQALEHSDQYTIKKENRKQVQGIAASDGLDKILVRHTSKLEREKLAFNTSDGVLTVKKREQEVEKDGQSLDKIFVKPQSKLEKAKLAAVQESEEHSNLVNARKEARERELQEVWGGLSLGNSMRPHLSRLEREKAAWRRAEEEARRRAAEL